MANERLIWVDSLKGWLILLVIIGHAIQSVLINNFESNHIWRLIYSFHMPAFIAVSGWIAYKKERLPGKYISKIWRRSQQLLVPYFIWSLFQFLQSGNYTLELLSKIVFYPDTFLWFLWVLFWISTLFIAMQWIADKFNIDEIWIIGSGCLILLMIMVFFEVRIMGFQFLSYYFLFYTIGYCINRYKFLQTNSFTLLLLFFGIWLFLAWFWSMHDLPVWIPNESFVFQTLIQYTYRGLTAFVAILVILNASPKLLNKKHVFNVWMSSVGSLSLGLYVAHLSIPSFFTNYLIGIYPNMAVSWIISLTSICAFVRAIIAVKIFASNKYSSRILLGKF